MTNPSRIEKPDLNDDRMRPGKLLLIAVLGFSIGFVIVWAREGGRRVVVPSELAQATEASAHRSASAGGGSEDVDPTNAANVEPPLAAPVVVDAGTTSDAGNDATAPLAAPAVDETTPVGTFARGRVAYLRCETNSGADDECVRDEPMEDEVWAILETLPRCQNPPRGTGRADLRLEFTRGGGATDVSMRARAEDRDPRLDGDRVLGCVAGQLSHVRSSMRVSRAIVSFRFEMQ